ncbi:MAG: hypothetical protein D8M59_04530 [Planctomycetes bacterium]|nr:hypothetical protein [Planctomycetota bacterium]
MGRDVGSSDNKQVECNTPMASDLFQTYADRFKQASRPMQTVVVLALLVIVYLAIDTEVRYVADYNSKSREKMETLDLYSGGFEVKARKVEEKHRLFGDIRILTVEDVGTDGSGAGPLLSRIVGKILSSENANITSSDQKSGSQLTMDRNTVIQRVPYEFVFRVSPGALPAIIEKIESDPHIARIVSLDVRRDSRDIALNVTLEAEIWWKS